MKAHIYATVCAVIFTVSIHPGLAQSEQYTNPILAGFHPDPSICRVGKNFYMVNSTFAYYPGIPVFRSTDLVNWKQIGWVMNRPSQLMLEGFGVSRGIFAPAIRFHNGIFYVTCTLVDGGGNFVVTAKDPAGPWSDPVWIPEVKGIDPSLFFDDQNKAYILYNSDAPGKPLYEGHRTIRMYAFDIANLKVSGKEHILVNGGSDISKKPIWIEGPHIFKKNGYYYLIAAEGGTGFDHSEVVFRSDKVEGPYIAYDKNPILTQRHLDPQREHPITSTGHADFVETEERTWWAVFLGCRPYEDDYYNTGRETFLAPVKWKNEWPVITEGQEAIAYKISDVLKTPFEKPDLPRSGNFNMLDEFQEETLRYNWMFLRTPTTQWYSLSERKGYLMMQLRPETCAEKVNPGFIGHRQQHLFGSVSTSLDFSPHAENEKAGVLVFQNEDHFYFLCKSLEAGKTYVQLYRSGPAGELQRIAIQQLKEQHETAVKLKVEAYGDTYSFLYAVASSPWILLKDNVDAKFLSTKEAGGFVGCMYALYATSSGQPSKSKAYFDWFEYSGEDQSHK